MNALVKADEDPNIGIEEEINYDDIEESKRSKVSSYMLSNCPNM